MMPGWATVAAFIEGVNELELRNIPLLAEEGNVARFNSFTVSMSTGFSWNQQNPVVREAQAR